MDPVGNIPLFAVILHPFDHKDQVRIIFREMIISLGILVAFQFLGAWTLDLLQISLPAVQVAGGIILFLIAVGMIFPSLDTGSGQFNREQEPFIVPLSVPLIAGPTILAAIMVYSRQIQNHLLMLLAIAIAWAASTIILIFTPYLKKILKDQAMVAVTRLMGLILTFIAIQMLLEGVRNFFPTLQLH